MGVSKRAWRVTGRVQGVGFRYYVQDRAEELGLRGWVRNCPDGSVEAAAAGSPEALARLEALLLVGPPRARVTRVSPSDAPISLEGAQGFEIQYG